ncbi:DgyrCDS10575 [Dimorphilus gyrociliatus]|uniref:DgyrCDS10575 n=1 Tax=Dimorphilus gyrociliatus TaxID=2664684 RepID=A0A7I8W1T9_9ANNE|nr:DgyrCDS10575 [Dimorphilus gyrociliatus]
MRLMPGLTANSLKKHPALIPLLVAIGGGAIGAFGYLTRLALKNPDVSWDHKNNMQPWTKMKPTDQYKFYSPNIQYDKLAPPSDRPEI